MSDALTPATAPASASATASLGPAPAPRGPAGVLALLYPYLADDADPRRVPEADRAAALALAVHFRPSCLPPAVQDIAQAHYAAHLLAARALLAAGGGTTTTVTGATTGGAVKRWSEGTVTVEYTEPTAEKVSTGTAAAGSVASGSPFAAWKALADMCRVPGDALTGGVVPGRSAAAARGYALLTGWP